MTTEEFQKRETELIDAIKESNLYKAMIALDKRITDSTAINEKAENRNHTYYLSTTTDDKEKKKEYLMQSKSYNDKVMESEEVKEYLLSYHAVKKLLSLLNEAILEELNHD